MDSYQSSEFLPNFSYGPCLQCTKNSEYQPEDLLECKDCHRTCHFTCLKSSPPQARLLGDNFFSFQCSDCNPQKQEVVERAKMSMIDVILLVLYNLHLIKPKDSKNGYFHYKKHIYRFMREYCEEIFSCNGKHEKCLVSPNVICGLLAQSNFFIDKRFGKQTEGKRCRWYSLKSVAAPAVLIYRSKDHELKGLPSSDIEFPVTPMKDFKTDNYKALDISFEDSALKAAALSSGLFDFDQTIFSSMEPLPSGIFDCVDELNVDIESTCEEPILSAPSTTQLLLTEPPPPPPEVLSEPKSPSEPPSQCASSIPKSQEKTEHVHKKRKLRHSKRKEYPLLKFNSVFTHSAPLKPPTPIKQPVLKEGESIVPMTVYDERVKLNQLNGKYAKEGLSYMEYLLRRKLIVRHTKREYGLPVFNIDEEVAFMDKHGRMMTDEERLAATYSNDNAQWAGGPPSVLDRYQISGKALIEMKMRKNVTFRERLIGTGEDDFDFIDSPYTGRTLKPFIWRNYEGSSPKLKLLQEVVEFVRKKNGEPPSMCICPKPIDYRYVTPNHIPALNHLAKTYFWDGIDLSEILQYPDFTCVASYGKLVIGFGVIVPDTRPNEGYISFLFVHPEWRRAGIGRFILYHLIQTCHGKDITLHVSATNPAMLMYQRFGFKVEEFLPNFYEKYLPFGDPQCKHAMFLRLHR